MRLVERFSGHDGTPDRPESMAALMRRPVARRAVEWLVAVWTAIGALSLILFQGSFSELVAAGMRDGAGQRLLGAQLAALAPVYGYCAYRRGRGSLAWLPIAGQSATAAVILFDVLAGHRHITTAAPALVVALGFAVLLVAFELAGDPFYRREAAQGAISQPREYTIVDQPTQRLIATDVREQQAAPPAEPPEDSLLGI
jgi:hypothetical protein